MFVMGYNPAGPTVFNVTSTPIVVKLQKHAEVNARLQLLLENLKLKNLSQKMFEDYLPYWYGFLFR